MNFVSSTGLQSINSGTNNSATLSAESFERWRQFIYKSCGIYFQDNKKYLLESRLLKRLNTLKLNSYEEYYDYLNAGSRRTIEMQELYEAITINETYFFRNQPQQDALIQKIIPELIQAKYNSPFKKIRIWSAASSSGEEAYSIAMVIKEYIQPRFPQFSFEIVGTDISKEMLEKARNGFYNDYAIKNLPVNFLKKYFTKTARGFEISSDIKKYASFMELNLYDDIKIKTMQNFDVIICANVLIYFDVKSKIKVVNHLYNALNKGGYLFIGYSETLHGISQAFKLTSFPKTIGYKKE
jgi:chemotaxis protein methyltransferase CheR